MDPFKEFGEKLKRARVDKGIELEDIENKTKIRIKYLIDMENGEFGKIPGGEVYIKGFISNYAKAVGLDIKDVIAEYKTLAAKNIPEVEDRTTAGKTKTLSQTKFIHVRSDILVKSALLFGVLILAVFSVFFVINRIGKTPEPRPGEIEEITTDKQVPPVETKLPSNDKPSDVQQDKEEVKVVKLRDDSITEYVVKKADEITVKLTVESERCWVSVKSDGRKVAEKTFEAGESAEWKAEKEMIIRIGNPLVSDISVNGINLGIPGGRSRDFIFKKME